MKGGSQWSADGLKQTEGGGGKEEGLHQNVKKKTNLDGRSNGGKKKLTKNQIKKRGDNQGWHGYQKAWYLKEAEWE